jgi:DNA primase
VQSIALIPDELERSAYIQETARILEMEERILFSELGQMRSSKIEKDEQSRRREQQGLKQEEVMRVVSEPEDGVKESSILQIQERALISLLLNHGEERFNFVISPENHLTIVEEGQEDVQEEVQEEESICEYILTELVEDNLSFEDPFLQSILSHFIDVYNKEDRVAKPEEFLRGEQKERMHLVVDLIADEPELHDWKRKRIYPPDKIAYLKNFTMEAVLRFKEKKISGLIQVIQDNFKAGKSNNPDDLATAQQLTLLKIEINKQLNRIL